MRSKEIYVYKHNTDFHLARQVFASSNLVAVLIPLANRYYMVDVFINIIPFVYLDFSHIL